MQTIDSDEAWAEFLTRHAFGVAYIVGNTCAVGDAVFPKLASAIAESGAHAVTVNAETSPNISGQLLVFALPCVLIFVHGKEFARFARVFSMEDVAAALERARSFAA